MTVFASKWLDWKAEKSQTHHQAADKTDITLPTSPSVGSVGSQGEHPEKNSGWDDSRERPRLNAGVDWCDRASWPGGWDWCRQYRPDLAQAVDAALDAINPVYERKDVAAHVEACRLLQAAVQAAADAYEALPEGERQATAPTAAGRP